MYHLFKQSRMYTGRPYCGPTSNREPAEYSTLKQARAAKKEFTRWNPVGWDIYDSETGKKVQ